MIKQTTTGKAFEYSILIEFYNRLNTVTNILILKNEPFFKAMDCFESFSETEKDIYRLNSIAAVNFLIDLEPRLSHGIEKNDILQLEIAADRTGQKGDVRDVLFIRATQKWEIGISAKNNHRALKHSRLSDSLDFGKKWIGLPCSENYFNEINPVFDNLRELKKCNKRTKWIDCYNNKGKQIYYPILSAFQKEMYALQERDKGNFAFKLVAYLLGNHDFYKLLKIRNMLEIQAFNFYGTLNQPFNEFKPEATFSRLKLPTRLIDLSFKKDSMSTLNAYFDEGWQISFRIHSAKSTIEPSLKFDINLISTPHTLFTHHIFI
jgi:hypothetical protein